MARPMPLLPPVTNIFFMLTCEEICVYFSECWLECAPLHQGRTAHQLINSTPADVRYVQTDSTFAVKSTYTLGSYTFTPTARHIA